MQTFLSEYSFTESAQVLDTKRLVKQLLEGRQIFSVLSGNTNAWKNHPAVKMWRGYELALYNYLYCIAQEMADRGYKYENNLNEINRIYDEHFVDRPHSEPEWMLDVNNFDRVVRTHRRSLYKKDPIHYAQYEKYENAVADVCCDRCRYYWPVKGHGERAIINT